MIEHGDRLSRCKQLERGLHQCLDVMGDVETVQGLRRAGGLQGGELA